MNNIPINRALVDQKIAALNIQNVGRASIRELVKLVGEIENDSGEKFIRMEMGVPGLSPAEIGTRAEIEALNKGVASKYPNIEGIPELKEEASRFVKLFMDVDIQPSSCVPSVGSMQGGCASFMVSCRRDQKKDTTLFIDPGFPVQKQQHQVLGLKYETFDVYNYRGEKLRAQLEEFASKGHISTILYSNPNNPSWICFTDEELKIIGEIANKYDIVVVEDLAYFAMDFRQDLGKPGEPPYQPTVAHYTDNYVLLISSSKVFSYAGQRLGIIAVSDKLMKREFEDLKPFFGNKRFGHCLVFGALYALTSGTAHSAQYAVAEILKAANNGNFKFLDEVKTYGAKAHRMKQLMTENNFYVVYDKDIDKQLADGFYFTFAYPGFSGAGLVAELLYYGISAISLDITGSEKKEGVRACTSQIQDSQFADLELRLKKFAEDHPLN